MHNTLRQCVLIRAVLKGTEMNKGRQNPNKVWFSPDTVTRSVALALSKHGALALKMSSLLLWPRSQDLQEKIKA